jgi:phenylacetic acid degradation operon negative regulatory protein
VRARSLLFTIFGDTVRPRGGEIPTAGLIRLMAPLGASPRAVRAALGRMVRQGWLRQRRAGRRAFYALTPEGAWRVEQGVRRVYTGAPEPWDGRWRLLTYTVAEGRRALRDRLRRELTWLGLAPLSRSTWITPRDLAAALRELCAAHGLEGDVAIFEAALVHPRAARALVRRCWDLQAIAARYASFAAATRRRAATLRLRLRRGTLGPAACFAERIRLVHEYRKFLFIDPGLPAALLPRAWAGRDAAAAFRALYRMLEGPALTFAQQAFDATAGGRAAGCYRPLKAGGRFSTKAATPSPASSEANARNSASRS